MCTESLLGEVKAQIISYNAENMEVVVVNSDKYSWK
jgi:hypothetical protein